MADFKGGAGKGRDELEHLFVLESKDMLQMWDKNVKKDTSQLDRTTTGQIWDLLSIKINDVSSRLKCIDLNRNHWVYIDKNKCVNKSLRREGSYRRNPINKWRRDDGIRTFIVITNSAPSINVGIWGVKTERVMFSVWVHISLHGREREAQQEDSLDQIFSVSKTLGHTCGESLALKKIGICHPQTCHFE